MTYSTTTPPQSPADTLACRASGSFQQWLAESGGSLVLSTYQSEQVALVGWRNHQITLLPRTFQKPMGLAVQGDRLALAGKHEVYHFANASDLAPAYLEHQPGRYDALFLPRLTYYSGDLNVHEVAFCQDELWVVNTRFSCLASLSPDFSFVPRWQPPFISELAPEDRCHLNGLAIAQNTPKYATALGETNTPSGWRAQKAIGGILIDIAQNAILCRGLSMPHSPRWWGDRLWVLNSGAGELLTVNPTTGETTVVCVLPGFLRGFTCVGDYALIGLSRIRETNIFGGLPLQERFEDLVCGVAIVHLPSGNRVGLLEFTAGYTELSDLQFLPSHPQPNLLSPDKPAVRQAFTTPDFSYWLRPHNAVPASTPST